MARCGAARYGWDRHVPAWRSWQDLAGRGEAWCGEADSGPVRRGGSGRVRCGWAGRGWVRPGGRGAAWQGIMWFWRGQVRRGGAVAVRLGPVRQGRAWYGGSGEARRGAFWLGSAVMVGQDLDRQATAWRDLAGYGLARRGGWGEFVAGPGEAGQGVVRRG
jgi:hypothetical protein